MNKIKLNFINKSNDVSNSRIVIFQKNITDFDSNEVVAWTVIQNCGPMENHPFTFPMIMQVSAGDSYGNYSPQLDANPGDLFAMSLTSSGDMLQLAGQATSPEEIQLSNNLNMGAISANIYRDGKLLATKTGIAPGQKATFQFKPIIYIGVASEIEEGDVMNSAILSDINTEINLLGIASADIVMTGGGAGPTSTPFEFNLENIRFA
jgi:hypothetical protein